MIGQLSSHDMPPSRSIGLIHTVAGLVPIFDSLLKQHLPDDVGFNILDESLLRNTIRDGQLSQMTMRRLMGYVWSVVDGGADAIVVTCSSLGPAVEAARPFCPVPLFRIDEGMAIKAVTTGSRIGVLATLGTTLNPTTELIRSAAARIGQVDQKIVSVLSEGAFQRLQAGDAASHDAIVGQSLRELAPKVDVIVLAQASMARALATVQSELGSCPVLTSPELGIQYVKECISA